ncbi:MAG: hypothetical protein J0I06_24415 [Planctomycetes bacterium]|nr:hypothetical protein [Planctomycetota bacterium]
MDGRPCDWLPDSFSRSPAWRMLRAAHRLKEKVPADLHIDDKWVDVAQRLLRPTGPSFASDAVRVANDLWVADQAARWHLEAQLLTTRPFDEVATACALDTPVVEAYHQLFFDVRPRLHASDWVLHLAVRSNPINDFAGPQPAGVWKYMGFMGGPLALDIVVAVTSDRPLPSWLRETFVTDPAFEEQRLRLKTKLSVAALTAKSASQLGSVLDLSEQLHDLEVAAGLDVMEEEPLFPAVGEFLAALGRLATVPPKAPAKAVPCQRTSMKRPRNSPQPTESGGTRRE